MTKIYASVTDDGRVGAFTSFENYAGGMSEVEADDGFDYLEADPSDYVVKDGKLTYDPLPQPEPQPDIDQRVTNMEAQMDALLGLSEEVADA